MVLNPPRGLAMNWIQLLALPLQNLRLHRPLLRERSGRPTWITISLELGRVSVQDIGVQGTPNYMACGTTDLACWHTAANMLRMHVWHGWCYWCQTWMRSDIAKSIMKAGTCLPQQPGSSLTSQGSAGKHGSVTAMMVPGFFLPQFWLAKQMEVYGWAPSYERFQDLICQCSVTAALCWAMASSMALTPEWWGAGTSQSHGKCQSPMTKMTHICNQFLRQLSKFKQCQPKSVSPTPPSESAAYEGLF